MPVLSGHDLTMQARESSFNKTTPIVIVTGRDEVDIMHKSFSHGATYFLHKPVIKEDLATEAIIFTRPKSRLSLLTPLGDVAPHNYSHNFVVEDLS
jgi:FixJ family two-component response regulator